MAAAAMHPDLEALLAEADAAADPEIAAARADAAELVGLAPATALARALAFRHPGLRPDQLSEIASAAIQPAPAAAAAADGPRLPALDTDRLFERCPVVARRVADVSTMLGVQRSAPAMCALLLASAAAADRLRLKVPQSGEPWTMPLHLYGFVAMPSGGNKSACQRAMGLGGGVDLLAEFADWAAAQVADAAAADRFARAQAQAKLTKAKDAAEAVAADKVLRRPPVYVPRLRLDDANSESFVRRAQESGYVAMHCDELADALDKFLGKKVGEDRLDVPLKAFSGSTHGRARVGEDREGRSVPFEELHASILWWTQPAVVSGQRPENRARLSAAADRGLWARFLVSMPERQPEARPVGDDAEATRDAYLEHMRRMLLQGTGNHPLAPRLGLAFHGYTAVVDEDAAARVLAYQARCRRDGQEGGRWHESRYLRAAAPRLGELAARLAGLLALLRVGELRHDIAVDLDDVERAIEALEGYFIPHLEALVEAAEASPVETLALRAYAVLVEGGPKGMTTTELLRGPLARAREFEVESHAERRTPLEAALEWLARRGMVVGEKAKPSAKALTWHPQIRHPFGAGRVAGQEVR